MKRKGIRTESLTELVFRNRNKDYGSYQLRRRYLKTLLISVCTGISLFLLFVVIPFLIYIIRDFNEDLDTAYIYEVEYLPFIPPEDTELLDMAKAHALPPIEKQLAPVITEADPSERELKPVQEVVENDEKNPAETDTSSFGTGGESVGRQANTDTTLATTIDVYPRYPGGEDARLYYLRRHVAYPKEAVDKGIQGVVMVIFVVEADGSVTNVKLLKGIGGVCDDEAIRVTREMPKWSPGKRSGRPVRVMVKMPIVFGIPKKS